MERVGDRADPPACPDRFEWSRHWEVDPGARSHFGGALLIGLRNSPAGPEERRLTYLEEIEDAKAQASRFLRAKGVAERYLRFDREGPVPVRRPTVPTDTRSEFLANRAMGDWAENRLAEALADVTGLHVVHYGEADTIAAGDDGFRDFYLSRMESVRRFGKRPDLLLFDERICPANVAAEPTAALLDVARRARAAIEVRSSKVEAQLYIAAREAEIRQGKRGGRVCPSFTVKVEDLIIVYRWLQHHAVPQFYAQVFFDSVYLISVLDIFRALRSNHGITIEQNANNQLKSTIHIPITAGRQIGRFTRLPRFEARERVTRLGRHDAYVEPVGGALELDGNAVRESGLSGPRPG